MVDKKILLVYGLANKDLKILKTFNKQYITVTEDMTGTKIEDLINGVQYVSSDKSLPKEKIILINGYSNKEVDVLMLEHLIKERDWYNKNNK